jgi:hypothetical protein
MFISARTTAKTIVICQSFWCAPVHYPNPVRIARILPHTRSQPRLAAHCRGCSGGALEWLNIVQVDRWR